MNDEKIIEAVKGLYPKYIKDKKECIRLVIDTLIRLEKITPEEICELSRLCGFSKEGYINTIFEKMKGDEK